MILSIGLVISSSTIFLLAFTSTALQNLSSPESRWLEWATPFLERTSGLGFMGSFLLSSTLLSASSVLSWVRRTFQPGRGLVLYFYSCSFPSIKFYWFCINLIIISAFSVWRTELLSLNYSLPIRPRKRFTETAKINEKNLKLTLSKE